MQQLRCPNCNKLIMRFRVSGRLEAEAKCPRCKQLVRIRLESTEDTKT